MASSYLVNLPIEIQLHKLAPFHLSTLGICNAYLNIGHVVGKFYDWPDSFYLGGFGANRNVLGKLGVILAIAPSALIRLKGTFCKFLSAAI